MSTTTTTSTTTLPPSYPVQVHHYPSATNPNRLVQTYEHLPSPNSPNQTQPQNALIFIGGLGDGPHTIPYPRHLAAHLLTTPALPDTDRYAVFEARLSSAFAGFGTASLAQDARELAGLVRYLRGGCGSSGSGGGGGGGRGMRRVVLMGHSTGCQDCLAYAGALRDGGEGWEGVEVDGLILQGPVSDREAIGDGGRMRGKVKASLEVAGRLVREGKGDVVMDREVMPKGWRDGPVTAYRWASLAGVGGDDDYFSSDLPDSKLAEIWGKLEQPVLIVPSEKDEWVPAEIDVMGLVKKWKSFCRPGIASELSGLIPGANHRVDNDAGQEWLADRVARFLAGL
ncbi:hypothetical protein CHGG_02967 [Chaetomium globosum CBS 148.51]|uniref:AB hydrolase-1 domain-containing protein n=1 Tax=Chaetomium globosum (strain ATCC 6205 / CBS 148.51 / DSM 1962 / NBRC 6347 / NRRL 1970) TaxID=306901 RepID=Q2H9Y7_CHAGB|nr:uncharacterized protein CHGG_02967 [Chaetomium globosum CBS 148.51]EAQ91032.1 hypothetical protein CHGG_02967 [Chaetomium globosum CBS 148.51]